MPGGAVEKKDLFGRRATRKWLAAASVALIVVIAAVVVTVVLVDRSHDAARRAAEASATSDPEVTSPYDLTELPTATDIGEVKNAAFISVLVPNSQGRLTSYGISSDEPAAQALTQAVEDSEKVAPEVAATLDGATALQGGTPTLTFVFDNRDTLTFALDLEHGLIARAGQAWRPDGELKALIAAATAGP